MHTNLKVGQIWSSDFFQVVYLVVETITDNLYHNILIIDHPNEELIGTIDPLIEDKTWQRDREYLWKLIT